MRRAVSNGRGQNVSVITVLLVASPFSGAHNIAGLVKNPSLMNWMDPYDPPWGWVHIFFIETPLIHLTTHAKPFESNDVILHLLFLFVREKRELEDRNHWAIQGMISYNFS
jgi:hypothetical protein